MATSRDVSVTTAFKKDFKREKKGKHRTTVEAELDAVVALRAEDVTLAVRLKDHALSGDWKGSRDCHIKPDLVLIYEKPDKPPPRLILHRLGSHSELGLA